MVVKFHLMEQVLKNIRAIREAVGYSQEQLAEKMRITQSQYARFERGATKTDLEMLYSFANVLSLNIIDIITYPKKFVEASQNTNNETLEATLQIKLRNDTKDQVLKLVFGENNLEILSK